MLRVSFGLLLACLASSLGLSMARGADVEFLRIWPGWRDADSFDRISEYFGRGENTGRDVILRTQHQPREGYYFLARVKSAVALSAAKFELSVIRPDHPEPKVHSFNVTIPARETVFQLGLTGSDWPMGAKANPVAWRLALIAADGRTLAEHKSFLWGKAREVNRGSVGADTWSEWRPLTGLPPFQADVFSETLDGGQAFRWNRQSDHTWLGCWGETMVRLRLVATGCVEWAASSAATDPSRSLAHYFGVDCDYSSLADTLPWRSDPHLAKCLHAFPGLRILRQPFGETLLGFLCSATKQIVQIKQMLALLAERHGAWMTPSAVRGPHAVPGSDTQLPPHFHRLPTWAELAEIPEGELRACLLGFRARYIAETARFLAANHGWLEETETLPYPIAKDRLCTLPGVGEKVADCVLLFGAGRLEAFPVDVWILKTLARRYGLDGWRPGQLAQFGRAHFGPLAGLAQQYLFAWERKQKREAREG